MKNLIILLVLFFGLSISNIEAKNPSPYGRVTFHVFYTSLTPYGEWIEIDYGVYAWRPLYVRIGWAPYLIGRWVWSPYGWYWDSFEPFGWAVYHYGRWYYDNYYGWIWIPDYEWAPAWVEWRYTDYYIGWAPLPPYARISITIGVHYSVRWNAPHYYWHFVPVKYFSGYEAYRYTVSSKYKYRIYSESRHTVNYKHENGRIINHGIDRNYVERKGGRVVDAKIEETSRLRDYSERRFNERDNRVIVYKPDEKNIDRTTEIRIRKIDRNTTLDVSKIQTPRERINLEERKRNLENSGVNERKERIDRIERDRNLENSGANERKERIDRIERDRNLENSGANERKERIERIERDRNNENNVNSGEKRKIENREIQLKRDENTRSRFELESKQENFESRRKEETFDKRGDNFNRREIPSNSERRIEERKYEPNSRTPSVNLPKEESRRRDIGNNRAIERQGEERKYAPSTRTPALNSPREESRRRDFENNRDIERKRER